LIPLTHKPNSQRAIDHAAHLASTLGSEKVLFELVFLEKNADPQKFTHPERPGWSWNTLVATGDPAEWILAAGADFDVDLIVMMTEIHTGLFDLLRGSTTERVVRGIRCPLLAIPARPDLPVLAP
jgi:hypothetical protein